jgi:hypothetical protein
VLGKATDDLVYLLDADDRIVGVNAAWTAFAVDNDGDPSLLPPTILGRRLWDQITDETTRQLYARLLERVRTGAAPPPIRIRCDSPAERRLLEMTLVARPAGAVEVRTRAIRIEGRANVELLDREARRSERLLRICSWCGRIPSDGGGRWLEVEEAMSALGLFEGDAFPRLSHGICEDCRKRVEEALSGGSG